MSWDVQELYEGETAILAQELYDKGLIFLVNQSVLHNYGYALGITIGDDDRVLGVNLFKSNDPEGIYFGSDEIVCARAKLREAGYR